MTSSVAGRRAAFALILSLLLMGFVALLIISLSTMVNMESRSFSTARQKSQAQANALLGLKAAIGETQKLLGPDQRITAEASILPTTIADKKHWLGAWNSDGSGTVQWLVSGTQGADAPLGNDVAEVVGTGTADETVAVPKMPVNNGEGAYAFWVSDLSQKARINLVDEDITDIGYAGERLSTLSGPDSFGVPIIDGFEALDSAYAATSEGQESRRSLANVVSSADVTLVNGVNAAAVREHFHDITGVSLGLQADVVDGGLKVDLSSALMPESTELTGNIFTEGPPWSLLKQYVALGNDIEDDTLAASARYPTTTESGLKHADPDYYGYPQHHGLSPLVLFWEFGFQVEPVGAPTDYQPTDSVPLQLQVEPLIVMVNPYDVAISSRQYVFRLTSAATSYETTESGKHERYPRFRLLIARQTAGSGLSGDYLSKYGGPDKQGIGNYLNEWLPDFPGHGDSASSTFRANDLRVAFTAAFEPGEIKVFTLDAITRLPDEDDGFLLYLIEGEQNGNYAYSDDITPSLQRPFTGADYDDVANTADWLGLRLSASSMVGCLYLDSVDKEHSNSSHNLTSTARVKVAQPSPNPRVYLGARLKGPIDDVNASDKPKSNEGAKTLAQYNIRSNYQSTILPASPTNRDFQASPAYSPFSEAGLGSAYNGTFSLWDQALVDADGQSRMVLFHVPREELVSLAELQHADVSFSVYAPTYAIGNSVPSPWIPGNVTIDPDSRLEDLSYSLNRSLWDRYFFSSIPQASTEAAVPVNRRLKVVHPGSSAPEPEELRDPHSAARWLMTEGPFNVNSTSVNAWAALLAGVRDVPVRYQDARTGEETSAMAEGGAFGRSPIPAGGPVPGVGTGDPRADDSQPEYWRGFRNLTDEQLRNLAGQIVSQVKARGPFLSLADFINRDPDSELLEERLSGPLQTAIDAETTVVVDDTVYAPAAINPFVTADNGVTTVSDEVAYIFPEAVTGLRSQMAPGYLSQADVLTQIGPLLTVRGDTYLIRAYGESIDPLSRQVIAVARCEAVIQRQPQYLVDPGQNPEEPASEDNAALGRAFRIVSFRWLSESDY